MKYIASLFLIVSLFGFNLKYKNFSAEFNQSVKSEDKTINYEGKLYIKNSLVSWHYQKPIEKTIWTTLDNKIYIYEPDLEQVTIYNSSKQDNFFKLIESAKKVEKNLYLKKYDGKNIYFKVKDGMISKIYYKDKIWYFVKFKFLWYKTKRV